MVCILGLSVHHCEDIDNRRCPVLCTSKETSRLEHSVSALKQASHLANSDVMADSVVLINSGISMISASIDAEVCDLVLVREGHYLSY